MTSLYDGVRVAFEIILSRDPEIIDITILSFQVSLGATIAASIIGIPLGMLLGYFRFPGRNAVLVLINTLTGFPPVVMGVFLYVVLSQTGPLAFLELLYTPLGMALAQFLLALPIIISISAQAIASLPKRFYETLFSLGITGSRKMRAVFRETRSALLSAIIIAFGRAISEVGAILIVGGNIRWYTRTLTTAAVLEVSKGRTEFAIALGLILLFVAMLVNLLFQALQSETMRLGVISIGNFIVYFGRPKHRALFVSNEHEIPLEQVVRSLSCKDANVGIKCSKISKKYQQRIILDDIDAYFPPRRIHVIIGPNGVGKSTLIRAIAGMTSPDSGKIEISGSKPVYPPIMHQKPYMFEGTTKDNLKITGANDEMIRLVISALGLSNLLNTRAKNLSGGEQKRVALARLLLTKPCLLVLDEPTSGLDPGSILKMETLLQLLAENGVTIILTSHDMLQAKRIGDSVTLLLNGRIGITGKSSDVFETDDPEIQGFFTGEIPW